MAERQGRPWVAAGVVVLTLVVTAAVAFCAVLVLGAASLGCLGAEGPCGPDWGIVVLAFVPAAGCLVAGLVWAWRVGTGRAGSHPRAARRGFWGRLSASARPVPLQSSRTPLRPPTKRHRTGGRP